jgi:AcrR family transcriptional regulator
MATTWRERQRSALRAQLLDASLALFRKQGFAQTTVQQIADEAGVSKGTFFNYFATKGLVLAEWYRSLSLAALEEVEARPRATTREALLGLGAALAARAAAEPDLWDMKSQYVVVDLNLSREESELDRALEDYCVRRLVAGKTRGEVDPDLDERFFAGMFIAVLTGTGHSWVVAGHGFDLEETVAARVDFLFRAVARDSQGPAERTE